MADSGSPLKGICDILVRIGATGEPAAPEVFLGGFGGVTIVMADQTVFVTILKLTTWPLGEMVYPILACHRNIKKCLMSKF